MYSLLLLFVALTVCFCCLLVCTRFDNSFLVFQIRIWPSSVVVVVVLVLVLLSLFCVWWLDRSLSLHRDDDDDDD